jgi:hypothetical protein
MKLDKPVISKKFDVDDIRKIREHNSLRHIQMTPEEIIADTRDGAKQVTEMLMERKEHHV